jgi:hypothetical protein
LIVYVGCFFQAINELKVLEHLLVPKPPRAEPPKLIHTVIVIVITQRDLHIEWYPERKVGAVHRDFFIVHWCLFSTFSAF